MKGLIRRWRRLKKSTATRNGERRMRPILDLDPAIGPPAALVAELSRDRLSAMALLEGGPINAGFEPGPRRRERSVRAATKLAQDDRDRS